MTSYLSLSYFILKPFCCRFTAVVLQELILNNRELSIVELQLGQAI